MIDPNDEPEETVICGNCEGNGFVGRSGTIPCRACRTTGEQPTEAQLDARDAAEEARYERAEWMESGR